MIISDSEILKSIESGEIIIKPFNPTDLGAHSYDVHLNSAYALYMDEILDVKKENKIIVNDFNSFGVVFYPGKIYLCSTFEYIESSKYMTFLDGKSSIARLGINIHITAGRIDIGFKGHITLEISVIQPIKMYPYMPIGQLTYMESKGEILNPYQTRDKTKYKGINSEIPVGSLMYKELK